MLEIAAVCSCSAKSDSFVDDALGLVVESFDGAIVDIGMAQ